MELRDRVTKLVYRGTAAQVDCSCVADSQLASYGIQVESHPGLFQIGPEVFQVKVNGLPGKYFQLDPPA